MHKLFFGGIFLILCALLFISPKLKAQEISLDYFEANQNQEQILLKWAISRGSVCDGITITRSSDSLYFEIIGRIEGVCGSPDFQQPYSFVDESPLKNQTNYYKLELGTSDFSEVISIELIDKNGENYQVRPHPMRDMGRIYFDNPEFKEWTFHLYASNGQFIYQSSTRANYMELDNNHRSAGLFFFTLSSNTDLIKGKIMIIK